MVFSARVWLVITHAGSAYGRREQGVMLTVPNGAGRTRPATVYSDRYGSFASVSAGRWSNFPQSALSVEGTPELGAAARGAGRGVRIHSRPAHPDWVPQTRLGPPSNPTPELVLNGPVADIRASVHLRMTNTRRWLAFQTCMRKCSPAEV